MSDDPNYVLKAFEYLWVLLFTAISWFLKSMASRVKDSERAMAQAQKDIALLQATKTSDDKVREIISPLERKQDLIFSELRKLNTQIAKAGMFDRRDSE